MDRAPDVPPPARAAAPRSARKLLFVNHSLRMGGIETMIRDFALSMRRQGPLPHVAVLEGGGALADELASQGVPVVDLAKRPGLDLGAVRRLRRYVREAGIDVVHSHNYTAWFYVTLATLGLGVRRIHTEHSKVKPLWRRRVLERQLARLSHGVVAVSNDVADNLCGQIGIPRRRVTVVPNGVDLQRYRPDAALRQDMRRQLAADEGDVLVGIVARLVPVKAHDVLLAAFAQVHAEFPRARLVLAGDGPCREALQQQCRELGLDGPVHFLGEVRDTPRVLNALDVYVLSSHSEGMNLTMLEAMGCGLPIVATAVGGNVQVVREGGTGLLVPPADPAGLARALSRLVADAGLRRRLGVAGRQLAESDYSQAGTLARYQALFG